MALSPQEIQNLLAAKSTEIGRRYAELPQQKADLRATLFGQDLTLSSLRENEAAKIKELYEHDKAVASNYQPETPGFIEDPGAKARFGSEVLARQGGELADVQKGIANRRDILGDALTKGMEIFTSGLDALKFEYAGLQDQFNNEITLQELRDKATGKGEKRSTSIIDIGGRKVLVDSQTGETIKDLGASGDNEAKTKALDALTTTLTDPANSKEDKKTLAKQWIENYGPALEAQGVDLTPFWEIYNKLPSQAPSQSAPKTSAQQTGKVLFDLPKFLGELIGGK